MRLGGGLKIVHWGALAVLLLSVSCIRKSNSGAPQGIAGAEEGIPMDVGIPLSPEVASALTGVEEDAEVDVYAGEEIVAEGVRGGIRAGVRGGIRASEQGGVRGGVRGGIRAGEQGGVRAAASRQASEDEGTIVYQFTFVLPTAHARDGANSIRSRVRSRRHKEVPFVEVTATVSIKLSPPPDPTAPPGAQPATGISFQIEEAPIPLNQVVLPDVDGDGVSSLVEVATAKATTGSIETALAAAADATSAPTQEQVVAAFTQLGKTLEKNLKDSGVTVKIDLEKIDVTPPDTTATLDKIQAKAGEPISVAASCSKSNCVYRCMLDTSPQSACPSPFVLNTEALPLAVGAHTLIVRAADPLGNTDQTAVVLAFTVTPKAECGNKICESGETDVSCPADCDKVPPDTSITKVEASDGTNLTGVKITNQDSLKITLTCSKASCTFECAIAKDGQFAFGPCINPAAVGLLVGDGEYTFRARAKDAYGNVDPTPAEVKITLDKTGPDTTISSQPSAVSNQKAATFQFSCSETGTLNPSCTFLCQLDTGTPAACTSPFAASNLGDGAHTFTVTAQDVLGNADATPAGFTWTIDTVVPSVTITSAPPAFTNVNKPTFTFASTEPTATLAGFECRCETDAFSSCSSPMQVPLPFSDGAHTCEVRSRDTAGNYSASAAASFTVDTGLPAAITVSDGLSGYTLDQDIQSDTTMLTAWWSASSDAGSGLDHYEVAIGTTNCTGASPGSVLAGAPNSLTTSITKTGLSLTPGTLHFLNVRTYDKAGNMRCDSSDGITIRTAGTAFDVLGPRTATGQPDFTTPDPRAPKQDNSFNAPGGLAYDNAGNRLFVADSLNHRVLVFNTDNTTKLPLDRTADFVLGQPNFTTGTTNTQNAGNGCTTAVNACGLNEPRGLAYDGSKMLYVADHANDRVLGFDLATITNGEPATEVLGQPNLTTGTANTLNAGNGCTTTYNACGMDGPIGLAIRTNWQCSTSTPPPGVCLFVSEFYNHRIVTHSRNAGGVFAPGPATGIVIGQLSFTATPVQATTQNGLKFPRGLAYDSTNALYVADSSNNRVLRYTVGTGIMSNQPNADALLGQSLWTGGTAGTTQGTLRDPRGVTVTNTAILVAEGNAGGTTQGRITVFSSTMSCTTPPTGCPQNAVNVLGQPDFTTSGGNTSQSGLYNPVESLVTGGYLYVADSSNHRVVIFDVTSITNGEPAYMLAGQVDSSGNAMWQKNQVNNAPASSLNQPWGAVVDTTRHRLFATDSYGDRVLVFNLNTDNALTDGQADAVLGGPNVFTLAAGQNAGQNSFFQPAAVALDETNGKLFVADSLNNRVLVFDVSAPTLTNNANAINVLGQPNFTSTTAACNQSTMSSPFAVVYDGAGKLYVSDNGWDRVLVFNVGDGVTNGENPINVLGSTAFTDCTGSASPNATDFSTGGTCGLALDTGTGRLFVGDPNFNRVLVFNVGNGITDGEAAVNVLGQANFTTGTAGLTQTGLSNPEGLALDPVTKRLYVADDGNTRVMIFDTTTLTAPSTAQSAIGVIGQSNFTSNTSGTSATLIKTLAGGNMTRLTLTGTGGLMMGDAENNRILLFPVQ